MTYQTRVDNAVGHVGRAPTREEYPNPETGEVKTYVAVSVCCGRGRDKRWFMVKLWDKRGDTALKLRKGDKVQLTGLYDPRCYVNKDGQAVQLHDVLILERRDFIRLVARGDGEAGFYEQRADEIERGDTATPDDAPDEQEQPQEDYTPPAEAYTPPPAVMQAEVDEDGNLIL